MPVEGVALKAKDEILTFEEIVRLVGIFASLGVDKVRFTGGEPLVRKEIERLTAAVAQVAGVAQLAMTTNGILLEAKLESLKKAGLTHLNISLDSLRPDRFEQLARRPGLERVLSAIDAALDAGYRPLKLNCVVLQGVNYDELSAFVDLGRDRPIDVRFIEFMPFQGNGWSEGGFVSYASMKESIETEYELERLESTKSEVAKAYRVPGFQGTVGFISSMTDDFCSGCNRLRLTADGNLKVCLFGHAEVSLRDAVRRGDTDDQIVLLIREALSRKKAAHDGMFAIASEPGRPMILIGG
jgi:cyclic pyranopterin phosphate synthase